MKKAISLLLILVMALCLCACGTKPESGPSEAEKEDLLKFFYGDWKYEDSDGYIVINEDGTWSSRDADMFMISEGSYSLDGETLVLKAEDNSAAYKLKKDGSKWIVDDEGRTLSRYEWVEPDPEEEDITPFLGMWKYDDMDLIVGINADGTWAAYDIDGTEEVGGVCYMRDGELVMENEYGDEVESMTLGSDDRLYDHIGDPLSPYEEPDEASAWFEENDLFVNYSYGDDSKTVVSGTAVRGHDTGTYTRIPAEWYVEMESCDPTGDGDCIISLTAIAFTDGSTMPRFVYNEAYDLTWSWSLCDYYCGVILAEAEDETFYCYDYESNGRSIHVEFCFSHEVTKYSDLSYQLELSLTVLLPEDYDGLVLACYNAPESYEVKLEKDLIYESGEVIPLDLLPGWREIASGLICRINE